MSVLDNTLHSEVKKDIVVGLCIHKLDVCGNTQFIEMWISACLYQAKLNLERLEKIFFFIPHFVLPVLCL